MDIGHDLGAPLVKESLVNEVTTRLRELILSGRLQAGTWLQQEELSQALGVSRTPLRQALALLVEEGFVRRSASSQYTVAGVDKEALKELYLVRRELDGLAAELAAERRALEEVRVLEKEVAAMAQTDPSTWLAHHRQFHALIYTASRNVYLMRNEPIVMLSTQLFYPQLMSTGFRMAQSHEEHQQILQAITAGDAQMARRMAVEHITKALALL